MAAADPTQPKSIHGVHNEGSKTMSSNNSVALEANQSPPQRIDVHHHFIPPCYVEGKGFPYPHFGFPFWLTVHTRSIQPKQRRSLGMETADLVRGI